MEVLINESNNNIRLTVTPTRVTLKLTNNLTSEETIFYKNLGVKISEELLPVNNSWRGKLNKGGVVLMSLDNGKTKKFKKE